MRKRRCLSGVVGGNTARDGRAFLIPMARATWDAAAWRPATSRRVIVHLTGRNGVLYDALSLPEFCRLCWQPCRHRRLRDGGWLYYERTAGGIGGYRQHSSGPTRRNIPCGSGRLVLGVPPDRRRTHPNWKSGGFS